MKIPAAAIYIPDGISQSHSAVRYNNRTNGNLDIFRRLALKLHISAVGVGDGHISSGFVDPSRRLTAVWFDRNVIIAGADRAVLTRQNDGAIRLLHWLCVCSIVFASIRLDYSRTGDRIVVLVRYLAAVRNINAAVRVDLNRSCGDSYFIAAGQLNLTAGGGRNKAVSGNQRRCSAGRRVHRDIVAALGLTALAGECCNAVGLLLLVEDCVQRQGLPMLQCYRCRIRIEGCILGGRLCGTPAHKLPVCRQSKCVCIQLAGDDLAVCSGNRLRRRVARIGIEYDLRCIACWRLCFFLPLCL